MEAVEGSLRSPVYQGLLSQYLHDPALLGP